jgi:hypothetical protein
LYSLQKQLCDFSTPNLGFEGNIWFNGNRLVLMRGPNFDKLIWALLALSPFQRSIAVLLLPVFFMVCCFAVVTDVGDSGDGSSCNEPMSVPVSSSKSHLLLEENLATAPVPTINPRSIPAIPEVYRLFIMWRKQCECS